MKKILLINIPHTHYFGSHCFNLYIPLNLLYVATAVKNICNVKILDCLAENFQITKTDQFYRYGMPFSQIKTKIKEFNPDLIGITTPFTAQSENVLKIIEICKKLSEKVPIILGGQDASVRYETFLKDNVCDYVIVGEGEKTFSECIKRFNKSKSLKGIEGVAYREKDKIHFQRRKLIEKLDDIPMPDYTLLNLNHYFKNKYFNCIRGHKGAKSISIISSRGCPFDCIFCSIQLHMGKKYRSHSPEYVIKHIKHLKEQYGITHFHFEDDNVSLNKMRFEKILDLMIEDDLNITWDTPNGLRADSLSYALLKKIKKSGCKELTIGIESGSQYALDHIIKKSLSLKKVFQAVRYCKKLKIPLHAFYVIGFPEETKLQAQQTIKLALKLFKNFDVVPHLNLATPLFGTKLYEQCVKNNQNLTIKDLSTGTQIYGDHLTLSKYITKKEFKAITSKFKNDFIFYSAIKFFLNPSYFGKFILNKIPLIKQSLQTKIHTTLKAKKFITE